MKFWLLGLVIILGTLILLKTDKKVETPTREPQMVQPTIEQPDEYKLCQSGEWMACLKLHETYQKAGQHSKAYAAVYKSCKEGFALACFEAGNSLTQMGNSKQAQYFFDLACGSQEAQGATSPLSTKCKTNKISLMDLLTQTQNHTHNIKQFIKDFQSQNISPEELLAYSKKCRLEYSRILSLLNSEELTQNTFSKKESDAMMIAANGITKSGIGICNTLETAAENPEMYQRLKVAPLSENF